MVAIPSLGSSLAGARAKVRRAEHHIRALKRSLKHFTDRAPYDVVAEQAHSDVLVNPAYLGWGRTKERRRGPLLLPPFVPEYEPKVLAHGLYVAISLVPRIAPPYLRWGIILGDAVHNLRSALDHLVWELVKVNPHPPPVPDEPKELRHFQWRSKRIAFPICDEREKWPEAADRCLFFVDPATSAVLQEAQPFYAWEHGWEGESVHDHPLRVLRELSNRDKHQAINLSTAAVAFRGAVLSLPGLLDHPLQLGPKVGEDILLRPIEGKTQLKIAFVQTREPFEVPTELQVHVNADLALGILFGEEEPVRGVVLDVLADARDEVVRLLDRFA